MSTSHIAACDTQNRDGFIGFAGWASDKNVKPFISAFVEWVDWFVTKYGEKAVTS